ncbi:MAG: LuxR C-terminal-related transcriptional regulator, partial [Chloroflexota bacterium]|nr:LuxR C-terminal-related transcriptional regulator [Chloroflexota bacterium]
RLADALGIREVDDCPLSGSLAAYLRTRNVLLLMDNLEQIADAAPALAALLVDCPSLKLLATSRMRLRVSGEYVVVVPPLELPGRDRAPSFAQIERTDSVRLFAARAEAALATFALSPDNAATVASICRRLDGLPLAIELAAAHCDAATPAELLDRLNSRLPLLVDGPRDVPRRQRALRTTIAWSHALLSPVEKSAFARLAVFVGGFTLEGAGAVIAAGVPAGDVLPVVSALLAKSLLTRDEGPGAISRYRMLETIREFALEQLAATGEETAIRRQHATWYVAFAERTFALLAGRGGGGPTDILENDRDNLLAAFAWLLDTGDLETCLRLAEPLEELWYCRGPMSEGRIWLKRALDAPGSHAVSPAVRVPALQAASLFACLHGDAGEAAVLAQESLALAREHGNDVGQAWALNLLGLAANDNPAQAAAFFDASLALYRTLDNGRSPAVVLNNRAEVADLTRARGFLDEALTICREREEPVGDLVLVLNHLGRVAHLEINYLEAGELFGESLRLCWENGDRWALPQAMDGLAALADVLGQSERAVQLCAAANLAREEVDIHVGTSITAETAAVLSNSRERLSAPALAAAWSAGRELALEEAVVEALAFAGDLAQYTRNHRNGAETRSQEHPVRGLLGLSPREYEVLRMVAEGLSDREIASALSITYRTTTTYVGAIFNKFGVSSRTAAVAHAHRGGLL